MSLPLEVGDELQAEHERLTQLLYQMPVGVLRCAADGAVDMMNPMVARLFAHLMDEWDGESVFGLLEPCFPDLRALIEQSARAGALAFEGRRVHLPSPLPGGEPTWLSLTAMKLTGGEFALVVADVTREVAREQQFRQASAWITALVQGSTAHMTCELDEHGHIVEWTASAERLTGWRTADVLDRHYATLFADDYALIDRLDARLRRADSAGWDLDEGWQRRRDAPPFFASCIVTSLGEATSGGRRYALVARDVTDRREAAEALRRMTVLDFLTGAYNRAYLYTVGEEEVVRSRLAARPVSVIMLDVDRFKSINDTHGHEAGDAVLKRLAALCQRQLRADDILARLGGEEFCALLPGCDLSTAERLAERMRTAIERETIVHAGGELRVTASFGVAGGSDLTASLESLVRSADAAVYRAKSEGRNAVRSARALLMV